MCSSFAAGIVLYNPNLERLMENIDAIYNQVSKIIIVDNTEERNPAIEVCLKTYIHIEYIVNNKNLGIAKALNQIVDYCFINNIKWVLTLDQDSVVPTNLIMNMQQYIQFPNIAIITPCILDRNDKSRDVSKSKLEYEYVERCITSAAFTNVQICKEMNGFDEKMFIDLVDFEYCFRVRKVGYKIIKINNVVLLHQLGNLMVKKILGQKIFVTNHSPLRCYYYARNTVYFYQKHKNISLMYVFISIAKKITKIVLWEDDIILKLGNIFKGIVDCIVFKIK